MPRIAIIGGGAAGAAVVGEFLRRGSDVELSWFVGQETPGRGVAYATSNGLHLLNVRAANMGLFADDPGGLMRFMQEANVAAGPADFVPRSVFGDYVEVTLKRLLADRSARTCVNTHSSKVIGLELNDGRYVVHTDLKEAVGVDGVVLAIGALPPVPIAEVHSDALAGGRYLPDPWQTPNLEQAPQRVVVLGSGLTAVDVILTAATNWPDAQIVALSRHGCLPAAHRAEPSLPYAFQAQTIESLRTHASIRSWVRLLRGTVDDDRADWRALIDGLRPVTIELWRSLDLKQRKCFLRHARWAWEAVRHRMPPQTAQAIELLRDEGRLIVVAGRIQRVEGRSPLALTYRRRDDGTTQTIGADLAIQATGLQTAVQRTSHPLLRQMFRDGLLRADAQGLGIDTDLHGRVIGRDGEAIPRIRVIGTLLRGALWECTALPEIRLMAARLVHEMPRELRRPSSEESPLAVDFR